MRVYLIGFMGAGKSTVGELLAERLGCRFVDLDHAIEARAGRPVRAIFEELGEGEFRRLEQEALAATLAWNDVVVATGGGTVNSESNGELVRRHGLAVWLHPPFATIASRIGSLGKEDRPLFKDATQALALYRSRLPAYSRADLTVAVGPEETPAEIVARMVLMLQSKPCAT